MKKTVLKMLTMLPMLLFAACSSHDCVGEWKFDGCRKGYPEIAEQWIFKVENDGRCYGYHAEKGGGVDYEDSYSGTWIPVSDDIVEIEMQSEDRIRRTTYSQNEIEQEVSKAQTPWAESRAYQRTSGTHISVGHTNIKYYLRNDGAISLNPDDFSWMKYQCKRN